MFKTMKEMLKAATVLNHYDPSKLTMLSSSPYVVGVVLSHFKDSRQ